MSRPPRILLSAGEASGDRLGAGLARELRRLHPGIDLLGMGGDEMAEAGVRLVQHASEVAVVGLFEVLSHLAEVTRAMHRLEAALERERPDLVVPIDFPEFNLRLASRAAVERVPVVYYVSPQIWAWRRGRVHRIRELVRRVLVLYPFERSFYEAAGVPVTFVGHPAAERIGGVVARRDVLEPIGLDPSRPTVALLPGSRRGEVSRLLPVLLEAAGTLRSSRPDLQLVIPRAKTIPPGSLERHIADSGIDRVRVLDGPYPEILEACDAGAVASGTATLDAALVGLPIVVVYRVQALTYLLARRLVRVDHIALPNLIGGRRIVPELVQGDCTGERIAAAVAAYLDDRVHADAVRRELLDIRSRLEGAGALRRAASAILAELG